MMEEVKSAIATFSLVRATLSKPRHRQKDIKNLYIEQIKHHGQPMYKGVWRHGTKDTTKLWSPQEAVARIEEALDVTFYNGDFFLLDRHWTLLQSKKGKQKWLSKDKKTPLVSVSHNKEKVRSLAPDTPWLQDLGIASSYGKIYRSAQDKFRQINRYVELVTHLLSGDLPAQLDVRDMGSGKGYLTFALHTTLKKVGCAVTTTGIELRQDLVDTCNQVAQRHELENLSFVKGSIDTYPPSACDMVIALHACDIATDMAIAHAVSSKATYVVLSPCCHKQVRKVMQPDDTAMAMLQHGIHMERQAEMVTDSIRALLLESMGYRTKVFEWISSEHTGKNLMITARRTGVANMEALQQVQQIKERYGVGYHYLERLLNKEGG